MARGSRTKKLLDRYLGIIVLAILGPALAVARKFTHTKSPRRKILLVCYGAIGDLILLSSVAKEYFREDDVFIACSESNLIGADIYADLFVSVIECDLRNPLALYKACHANGITHAIDSTQWANIGPIHMAVLKLLSPRTRTFGFASVSTLRNLVYDNVVRHSDSVHEVVNFFNLLNGEEVACDNSFLPQILPSHYSRPVEYSVAGGNILLHLWPSGERSHLKEWPEKYWVQLIDKLCESYEHIYISGSPQEEGKNDNIITQCRSVERITNLAGKLSYKDLYEFLLTKVCVAISVNTGNMHLAALAKIPVIGLNGPTAPHRWGPIGLMSVSLQPTEGNFGYLNYGFEYPEDDNEAYSLNYLSVEQVLQALKTINERLVKGE